MGELGRLTAYGSRVGGQKGNKGRRGRAGRGRAKSGGGGSGQQDKTKKVFGG